MKKPIITDCVCCSAFLWLITSARPWGFVKILSDSDAPIKKQFFVSRLFSMGKNLGNVLKHVLSDF